MICQPATHLRRCGLLLLVLPVGGLVLLLLVPVHLLPLLPFELLVDDGRLLLLGRLPGKQLLLRCCRLRLLLLLL